MLEPESSSGWNLGDKAVVTMARDTPSTASFPEWISPEDKHRKGY